MPQISLGMQQLTKLLVTLMLLCVAEIHSSPKKSFFKSKDSFDVFWNVPTYLCKQHQIYFEPVLKNFGIKVNTDDNFRGDKIVILYDPGAFPAVMKNHATKSSEVVNGGIPQKGDLQTHLVKFRKVIEDQVPKDFEGLGVIDFELYRPIWRQNWNDQVIHLNLSKEYERNQTSCLTDKECKEKAEPKFEEGAKQFMLETLKEAKKLRPNAKWGYYGYPYCYNTGEENTPSCVSWMPGENDRIQWLFSESTAYYPSVYVKEELSEDKVASVVEGRLLEAKRLSDKVSPGSKIPTYPYVWYRHVSSTNFLTKEKMFTSLNVIKKHNLGGAIIWGSSDDAKSKEACKKLLRELKNTIGPAVEKVKGEKTRMINGHFRTWHMSQGKLVPPP